MGYGNEAAFQTHYRTITVGGTMYRTNADGSNRDDRWYCGDGSCDHYTGEDGSNYGACVSIWAPGWKYETRVGIQRDELSAGGRREQRHIIFGAACCWLGRSSSREISNNECDGCLAGSSEPRHSGFNQL